MNMIINGKAVGASDGAVIEVINPANGKVVDTVPAATEQDIIDAVAAAKAAQKIWAKVPVSEKAEIMMKFISLVERDKEDLAQTLSQETGKPITEARAEIANIPIAFKAFSERAKHLYGEVVHGDQEPGQQANLLLTMREPIGVIACVIPFNFPCDLFDQKVAPTLLAGNAAIIKPSTDNPLTLCKLTALMVEAGVTDGAVEIVTGRGSKVGNWLCSNPDVSAITFTGSTEVGIQTAKNASDHLAHISLELGGNDAFIVLEDGDVDLAVEEMIWGRMYNCGQVCCASKRFIVHNSLKDEFAKKAVERIKKIKVGDPADDSTQLACLISESAAVKVEAQVAKTVEQGGKIILGGKRNGAFYEPTVIADVPKTADVAIDMEIFGPVVPIIGFDTTEEAIEIANASKFGLCGCVFTANMKTAFNVCAKLECGGTIINGASFFRSFEMPFGGYKYSGIGTEGVLSTFDEVTRTKTVVLKNIFG
ncbi:MAG: aldehyde dehydrogenase [Oscillospiraceae bacterium]|nr:aldehyde dehydrogenase [Oscillospiraceae bacterium]